MQSMRPDFRPPPRWLWKSSRPLRRRLGYSVRLVILCSTGRPDCPHAPPARAKQNCRREHRKFLIVFRSLFGPNPGYCSGQGPLLAETQADWLSGASMKKIAACWSSSWPPMWPILTWRFTGLASACGAGIWARSRAGRLGGRPAGRQGRRQRRIAGQGQAGRGEPARRPGRGAGRHAGEPGGRRDGDPGRPRRGRGGPTGRPWRRC